MKSVHHAAILVALLECGAAVAGPPAGDPETSAWWAITASLSNDAMEGRDTGSAAYDRAAHLVADRFAAAGLVPMGERGTWLDRKSVV